MSPKARAVASFGVLALAAGLVGPAVGASAEDCRPDGDAAEHAQAPAPAAAAKPADAPKKAAAGSEAEPGESARDELSRRATDPTASPPSIAGINEWTTSYRDLADGTPIDGEGYQLKVQSVTPFKAWGVANILRMTVPYQVSGPARPGLGDVTIFDLVILPQSWGRLGVGAVASLVQAEKDADGHFAGGPAIGVVVPVSKKLNLGVFNQNLFGDGVSVSQIQPIAAYQLGGGWSLSLGDLQWPYDWDRGEFVSMPIGLQLGKVQAIAGQPMRFSVNPQYDMKDLPGIGRFKIQFTVQLIMPEGKK